LRLYYAQGILKKLDMNLPTIFKPKPDKLKERILENSEAVLSIMAKNIQGARQCPYLLGKKCLGQFCELFQEYSIIDGKTGEKKNFWQCVHKETADLLIELNRNIRQLKEALDVKTFVGDTKK